MLELVDVAKRFPLRSAFGRLIAWLRAVDGVSLRVERGAVVGIVGESGCGKSSSTSIRTRGRRWTQGRYLSV